MRTVAGTRKPAVWPARIAASIAVLMTCGAVAATVSAQTVQSEKAQSADAAGQAAAKKEAAQRAYEAGIKAFEAGKTDPAVKSLSTALQTGGLPSEQMAKALYYRGMSYRKQDKSAQAIADLTSAIWLKNGLTGRERSDATENRAAAYREAGISEGGGALPWVAAAPAEASGGAQAEWDTATTKPGARASPPASPAQAAPVWQTATTEPGIEASPPASAPAAAPARSPPPAETGTTPPAASTESGGIGGFFSNLFGGVASTGATPPAPPPAQSAPARPAEPQVSSWTEQVTVSPVPAKRQVAAIEAPARPQARALATPGKYRLQVATVRSREEADALAARLRSEHGASLGAAAAAVDETVMGNMGTFFRVQVGPYRTPEESGKVCQNLKASGYDCLVLTQ